MVEKDKTLQWNTVSLEDSAQQQKHTSTERRVMSEISRSKTVKGK